MGKCFSKERENKYNVLLSCTAKKNTYQNFFTPCWRILRFLKIKNVNWMLFISDWHFIIFKSGRMLQSNSLRSFGPCAVIQKFYMYFSFFNKVCVKKNVPVTTYDYDWVWYVCQKRRPYDNLCQKSYPQRCIKLWITC